MFDLTGRRAIVTGGREGLGFGIAAALMDAGAQVAIIDRAKDVADFTATLPRAIGIRADLTDRAALHTSFVTALDGLGGSVDILVNSAGIRSAGRAEEYPLDDWDRVIELNLTSVFALCQAAGRVMLSQGRGSIINLASIRSFVGSFETIAYGTSKGGIAQLTRSLSNEWAPRGVRVNAIAPGFMLTRLAEPVAADPRASRAALARVPMARWGTPADLAGIALLLASDASSYISGAIIPVDGGFLAR